MKKINYYLLASLLTFSSQAFSRGGDDVGNGGFAYKQSFILLKLATRELEGKIKDSTLPDIVEHPERRAILQDTLGYEDLDKKFRTDKYRGGRKLAMDYTVNPPNVIVLKPYFEAFMGRTDSEFKEASLEVQKRLLHEAAHIWGYKEVESEAFAKAFLENARMEDTRPTNDISIGSFCACKDGKPDIISDNSCTNFCKTVPNNSGAVLFVNAVMGPKTQANSRLGNLFNWCTVQLSSDETSPQCTLLADDGNNEIEIPVNIKPKSNAFSANIDSLYKNRTWTLKLKEFKTGSDAETNSFQIRRVNVPLPGEDSSSLKVDPLNEYNCIDYGYSIDSSGEIFRDGFIKKQYFFPANETPKPLPPVIGVSTKVCHDESMFPGNDSVLYPRLDLKEGEMGIWSKFDQRFTQSFEHPDKSKIEITIARRLMDQQIK